MAQDYQRYGQRDDRQDYDRDDNGRGGYGRGRQAEQYQDFGNDRYQSDSSYGSGRGQFGDDDYTGQRYSNDRFSSGGSYGSGDDGYGRSGGGMGRSQGGSGRSGGGYGQPGGGYGGGLDMGGRSGYSGGRGYSSGSYSGSDNYGGDDYGPGNPGFGGGGGYGSGMGGGSYGSYGGSRGSSYDRNDRGESYVESRGNDDRGFFERAGDEVASWFGDEEAERRRRQDHRGRGPANYQRSNERLLEDACERLTHNSRIDASNITVTADNNEITLDGMVDSRSAKRHAEDCVHDISGVKHVQNNLRINDEYGMSDRSSYSSIDTDTNTSSRTKTETT